MMKMIEYQETESFKKDFKKLSKKFKTLSDDIEVAKRNSIELLHLNQVDNQSNVIISGYNSEPIKIYKLRKFACKALKGKGARSGIRIVYAYEPEKMLVTFIEIYFKAEQANESKNRIEQFLRSVN